MKENVVNTEIKSDQTNKHKDYEKANHHTEQQLITAQKREYNRKSRKRNYGKLAVQDITLIGMMVAVIEVCKFALSVLPNIELTSFWLIMFTICFGWRIVFVVPVFILIEGSVFGFGPWWVAYLYVWPILVLFTWVFRKKDNKWFWAILSGIFGLCFGALCAFYYVIAGVGDNGLRDGLYAGFTWWVSGIPWDIIHGVGNFALMLVLYNPIRTIFKKIRN